MAKTLLKKFAVVVIATAGLVLAGNSLQAKAETVEPEEVTLVSDVDTSDKFVVAEVLDTDETTESDTVKAEEDKILDEGFAVDSVYTDEVETPSTSKSEVSDVDDDWLNADADDEELVPEVKGDSMVESKSKVNVDDDDDWIYVDFDSEPEVKGDDIITPEEPTVPEEPQPQPVVPETPILTEPTVQPMQTPVVLGDSLWTAPKTGDTLTMIAVCIIAALLAAGVIVLSLQRKRKKEERRRRTQFSTMIQPDHLIDH